MGAENRKKLLAALLLGAVAIVLFARMLLVQSATNAAPSAVEPPSGVADRSVPPAVRGSRRGKATAVLPSTLDPRLQLGLLKSSEETRYEGRGRNIFQAQEELPPIPQPQGRASSQNQMPQPPANPGPPPINLKFFGFASQPGESKKVFLSEGEDVFIAGEGDIVDRRYKIVHIGPNSVEVEDVLNNNRQSIPLTSG